MLSGQGQVVNSKNTALSPTNLLCHHEAHDAHKPRQTPTHAPRQGMVLCSSSRMYESKMSAAARLPPPRCGGMLLPVEPLRQLMPLLQPASSSSAKLVPSAPSTPLALLAAAEVSDRGEVGPALSSAPRHMPSCTRCRFLRSRPNGARSCSYKRGNRQGLGRDKGG